MEQSSGEANRFSASQEILPILWNPKVYYRIYKCLPPSQSWARSIHSMPHRTPQKITFTTHDCTLAQYIYTWNVIRYWSQTWVGGLSPARTTAKVNCRLRSRLSVRSLFLLLHSWASHSGVPYKYRRQLYHQTLHKHIAKFHSCTDFQGLLYCHNVYHWNLTHLVR
jgi:hypothetical protein